MKPVLTLEISRRRAVALALSAVTPLATLSVPDAATAAPAFDLAALTKLLSQVKSGQATFTERRQVAMLDRTLESSGVLSFEAPDTFVRETLKPRQERLAVVGNTLTMSQGSRSRTLALDSAPEAGLIVEAIRGTLTGNRETLERYFEATVRGTAEQWSLMLRPRDARLRGQVASFRITGQKALLREIEVAMPDGDNSVMTIETVTTATTTATQPGGAATAAPAR